MQLTRAAGNIIIFMSLLILIILSCLVQDDVVRFCAHLMGAFGVLWGLAELYFIWVLRRSTKHEKINSDNSSGGNSGPSGPLP